MLRLLIYIRVILFLIFAQITQCLHLVKHEKQKMPHCRNNSKMKYLNHRIQNQNVKCMVYSTKKSGTTSVLLSIAGSVLIGLLDVFSASTKFVLATFMTESPVHTMDGHIKSN